MKKALVASMAVLLFFAPFSFAAVTKEKAEKPAKEKAEKPAKEKAEKPAKDNSRSEQAQTYRDLGAEVRTSGPMGRRAVQAISVDDAKKKQEKEKKEGK